MLKLLFSGRCPATLGPVPWPTPPDVATPAPSRVRFQIPDPSDATPSPSVLLVVKVVCNCADEVSSRAADADTSTEVVTVPTCSVRLTVDV